MKTVGENESTAKAPKKTVSFESIPDELAKTNKPENRNLGKARTAQSSTKKNVPTTFEKVLKTNLGPQQPSTSKTITTTAVGNNNDKKKAVLEQKTTLNNGCRKSNIKTNTNPTLKTKTETLSTKDKTVVGQVLQNLSQKKSILKQNKGAAKSSNVNSSNKGVNTLIRIVDQNDTIGEFDKWIEERSQKIRQIHDELNKMVAGSMANYLENQPFESGVDSPTSDFILLQSPKKSTGNKRNVEHQPEDINAQRAETNQSENQALDDQKHDSDLSVQDAVQEYDEDFEEDVEEVQDNNGSDSNIQKTGTEVQNDSSSSSNEVITTDEDISREAVADDRSLSDVPNMTKVSKTLETGEMKVNVNPIIHTPSDVNEKLNNGDEAEPKKVSVATSPINFKLSTQSVDVSVNTSLSNVDTGKVTTATSPLKLTESDLLQVKSTLVQTESSDIEDKKNFFSLNKNSPEVGLSVPQMRLNPTPIGNVLKVTLGEVKDNSLSLHADSSNQTLQLIVQLPPTEKIEEQQKIIELDCSDQNEREKYSRDVKSDGNFKSKTKDTNQKRDLPPPGGSGLYDTSSHDKLSEQAIKDIIEPTVSEVLRKINKDKNSTTSVCQNEEVTKPLTDPNSSSWLVKPSIILQTKHGLWRKCDENPFVNIIDFEQSNLKVDSSNQTEAEKQNACVQVARSVAGSCHEKATSVRNTGAMSDRSRSYLEMLLPLPPSTEAVPSSLSYTSTCRSSSTSTVSSRKYGESCHMDNLSDGELLPTSCNCKIGDVCEVCVPRLDLSFGELKTKKRGNKVSSESDSFSGCSKSQQTSLSLSNLPRYLEPRPQPSRVIPSSAPSLNIKSSKDMKPTKTEQHAYTPGIDHSGSLVMTERRPNMKHFSEVAKSVLSDLGKELQTLSVENFSKHSFPKPPQPPPAINFPSASNKMETSSSDSLKSSKSQKISHPKKRYSNNGTKPKTSLMIKTPVETPRIDVVIEDSDLSTSSYQTSVTSVSVDQLPEVLSSHSSADASS